MWAKQTEHSKLKYMITGQSSYSDHISIEQHKLSCTVKRHVKTESFIIIRLITNNISYIPAFYKYTITIRYRSNDIFAEQKIVYTHVIDDLRLT